MCGNGVTPDETALSTLLPGMIAAQQWDRVIELVRLGLQGPKPISIPPETLNNALSQMKICGLQGLQASQLRAVMQEAGVPLTARNAKRFGAAA